MRVGRLAVRLPVVADEHRLRVPAAARRLGQAPGARDRQRRADAVLPRRVAGRGHDAAARPALGIGPHHHRAPAERGVQALLDGGVERVHVHVSDDAHGDLATLSRGGIDPVRRCPTGSLTRLLATAIIPSIPGLDQPLAGNR